MKKFKRIKIDYIRKNPASIQEQRNKVDFIMAYYHKALYEEDEFMRVSAIENLIYQHLRGFLNVDWFNVGFTEIFEAEELE